MRTAAFVLNRRYFPRKQQALWSPRRTQNRDLSHAREWRNKHDMLTRHKQHRIVQTVRGSIVVRFSVRIQF